MDAIAIRQYLEQTGRLSISFIQRAVSISYNRAREAMQTLKDDNLLAEVLPDKSIAIQESRLDQIVEVLRRYRPKPRSEGMLERHCPTCGATFFISRESPMRRFCSWQCAHPDQHRRVIKECPVCGKEFTAQYGKGRYCSRQCHGIGQRKAPGNLLFRGYILLHIVDLSLDDQALAREMTSGSMVAEHRLVMARVMGRPLLPEEIVHHINEAKADNRPENLTICMESEHELIHILLREVKRLRRALAAAKGD